MDKLEIINKIKSFLLTYEALQDCLIKLDRVLANTFDKCLEFCFKMVDESSNNFKLEIDSLLDYLHDELNTGHWSKVPLQIRHAFTATSYLKSIIYLKLPNESILDSLEETLKIIDLGLLLGAPLLDMPNLLTDCANYLSQTILSFKKNDCSLKLSNKRKLESELITEFEKLKAIEIKCETCPSLETFSNLYFNPQKPVKLKDCMSHWSASRKWLDVNYLMNVVGNRTIPIEIGSHYVDNDWHQKLMLFKDFIRQYFLLESGDIAYLAQHNLFDQVPELRKDICIPEYCCISNSDEDNDPDINAWLGPKGTVSPLHQDPKNNLLAQVFGTKQLLLFSPTDDQYLYPFEGQLLSNTSQVDPIEPALEKYPNFAKATMYKCLLEPGEMLYIPVKWWHHVTALEKSFSVSFWWQ